MRVGVPKEIKSQEYRVGLIPAAVREFYHYGHQVIVESGAAREIGFSDEDYRAAGAEIVLDSKAVFATADMIIKVKEPQPDEISMLRPGQILFTYLHLAADKGLCDGLLKSSATCIAYETVTDPYGGLPLLAPMSEVAGRMSIQVGARCLEREYGGCGILLGGVPGVPRGKIVILGGGVSGTNAARRAMAMEASVTVIDKSLRRLNELDSLFGSSLQTLFATAEAIETEVRTADLVIGAVLIPGAPAPKLVSRDMVSQMKRGSAIVDIAIDQGGCFETSRPTTHAAPTFEAEGVIHYCVANMPGAVARTSTIALNNATLPFALALANNGWKRALKEDSHLRNGLNVYDGQITHPAVASALGIPVKRFPFA